MKTQTESPRTPVAVFAGANLQDRRPAPKKHHPQKALASVNPKMTREEVQRIVAEVLG
jgi:hypothetical protein